MDWQDFKRTLKISNESSVHPHAADESADLFSSTSFESTEIEYLDLIHSIVRAAKPTSILETGSHHGLSAAAIGFALKENSLGTSNHGRLISLEKDRSRADLARVFLDQCGLASFVVVTNTESTSHLATEYAGLPFEVVYFDSSRSLRALEFDALRSRSLLAPNALLIFHDTSIHRAESMPEQAHTQQQYLEALDQIACSCRGSIVFSLSRGFTLMQFY